VLIDRASKRVGKNRSEFMLAACREAAEVLLNQRLFMLGEKAYKPSTRRQRSSPCEERYGLTVFR
jgi:uncharacterized protein (DUF1778 family)